MQQKKEAALATEQELEALLARLAGVLEEEKVPGEVLRLQRNKGTTAILLRSDLICRLTARGDGYSSLAIGRQFAGLLPAGWEGKKAAGDTLAFPFEQGPALADWGTVLCEICRRRIWEIPKQFDCCDRYEECSDAGFCTNPDLLYAMECGYKKLLRQGRVFYGKNRNAGEGEGQA